MRVVALVLLLVAAARAGETGALEGRVIKGDGAPWAGAQVTAVRVVDAEGKPVEEVPVQVDHPGTADRAPPTGR